MLYAKSFLVYLLAYTALRFVVGSTGLSPRGTGLLLLAGVVLVLSTVWFAYQLPKPAGFLATILAFASGSMGLATPVVVEMVLATNYWESHLADPDAMVIFFVLMAMVEIVVGGLAVAAGAGAAQYYRYRNAP